MGARDIQSLPAATRAANKNTTDTGTAGDVRNGRFLDAPQNRLNPSTGICDAQTIRKDRYRDRCIAP